MQANTKLEALYVTDEVTIENGLITATAKTAVEGASKFFNFGEDVIESINSTINTVGFLGIFSAIGVTCSVGGMIFKFIKGKKERNKIRTDLEKIKELDNKLYKSDIEKGKRNAPTQDILEAMVHVLKLNDEDKNTLFDLAADSKNEIARDITEYVSDNQNVRVALRRAKELNLGEEEWLQIIEDMMKGNK